MICRRCFRTIPAGRLCPRCAAWARAYIDAATAALIGGVFVDDGSLKTAVRYQTLLAAAGTYEGGNQCGNRSAN